MVNERQAVRWGIPAWFVGVLERVGRAARGGNDRLEDTGGIVDGGIVVRGIVVRGIVHIGAVLGCVVHVDLSRPALRLPPG